MICPKRFDCSFWDTCKHKNQAENCAMIKELLQKKEPDETTITERPKDPD
jgi:hypothetical protein